MISVYQYVCNTDLDFEVILRMYCQKGADIKILNLIWLTHLCEIFENLKKKKFAKHIKKM